MRDIEKEMKELKARLKELSAKRFRRFNVLLKNEAFEKLEQEATKNNKSKAKMLAEMIKVYKKIN